MDYWITKLLHILLIFGCASTQEVFNTMPPPVNTSFTCRGREMGFYADVETNCRVYHTCDDHGNKFTYYCPEETAFRQEALVCDHAHLVDCTKGQRGSTFAEDGGGNVENASPRLPHVGSSLSGERSADGRSIDVFHSGNSNPAYTRSFRITAEPPAQLPTAKSLVRKQPTFVLNSSVFFRDRANFQKASPASQTNRVATESSKNLEKIDENDRDKGSGVFAGKIPSATSTTTFRPFRADLASPADFGFRYFDKKREDGGDTDDEDGGYSGRFSSPISTTTFRPFGADFKVKSASAMDSRSSSFDVRNEKVGAFGGPSSATSTTTFKPFGADFKVGPIGESTVGFQFRDSKKKDEGIDRSSLATSSSTFRPFGADFKAQGDRGDLPSFGKVKLDKVDESSGGRASSGGLDHEAMSPKKGFQFDDKRRNEQKGESSGGFGSDGRGSGGSSASRDTGARNWQGFAKSNERSGFFFDNNNFPYSETLRSMQATAEKSSQPNSATARSVATKTTTASTTTAGTEFPVHPFTGSLSPLVPNELEDDPYYPRRPTTTEAYYKLSDREKGAKRPYRFSTRRPWPGSLDFEIPDVLPDFNTLDDLVDRRKLFFIPRVKAT